VRDPIREARPAERVSATDESVRAIDEQARPEPKRLM